MTTDCTHWNPQTPVRYPSISPSLSLFSPPPTPPLSTYTLMPPSIYTLPSSSTSILLSIQLPPPNDLPNAYLSSIFVKQSPAALTAQLEHFPIRDNANLFNPSFESYTLVISAGSKALVKTIIQPDTSCPYLPPSSRAKPSNSCLFSLNASPAPSLSSRLQTSDHKALIGGLRGNSYHTAII